MTMRDSADLGRKSWPEEISASSAVLGAGQGAGLSPPKFGTAATTVFLWGVWRALRQAAGGLTEELAHLSESATGTVEKCAISAIKTDGLSDAAKDIDGRVGHLTADISLVAAVVPTLQRLTEIVDPLVTTAVESAHLVDRLPGGRRIQNLPAHHRG